MYQQSRSNEEKKDAFKIMEINLYREFLYADDELKKEELNVKVDQK